MSFTIGRFIPSLRWLAIHFLFRRNYPFTTIEHGGKVVLLIPGDDESARALARLVVSKLGGEVAQ